MWLLKVTSFRSFSSKRMLAKEVDVIPYFAKNILDEVRKKGRIVPVEDEG